MGKVGTKKHSTFIDMTAMSDVTVLLLTFFMLTATFKPKEPVEVLAPASVSERKVPEYDVLNILISTSGQVFLQFDRPENALATLNKMGAHYNMTFTEKQKRSFVDQPSIGVPMNQMSAFLDLKMQDQDAALKTTSIPVDSVNNQLANWVKYAVEINEDIKLSIKADQNTPYPQVQRVMKTLVDVKQNRYSLQTTLKGLKELDY